MTEPPPTSSVAAGRPRSRVSQKKGEDGGERDKKWGRIGYSFKWNKFLAVVFQI